MAEFAPLFPLETQFQAKDGRNNTAGFLKVFLAATDTPADTYSDYTGTRNPEIITLDNNGRAVVICDKDRGYRLEVYDANGALLWTEEPVFCTGGGGGATITNIVSTNGSVTVDKSTVGGTVTYDLGIAPSDSPEFLEWSTGFRGNMTYGSSKIPYYSAGTMTFNEYGVKVYKDRYYHITSKFFVRPTGTRTQYDTFECAIMLHNPADGTSISVEIRKWDIDSSLTDEVQLEMSFDLVPNYDGELSWEFYNCLPLFQSTDAWIQIHRVYSGINAVPDTCATKQWVSSNYQPLSGMSSYVAYSAIEHNGDGAISGIHGSAIVGELDTDTVSAIASSYAESAASSKLDSSASSEFYLTSNPSGFITGVDLSPYQLTADMTAYARNSSLSSLIDYSALEYDGNGNISGISGSAIGGQGGTDSATVSAIASAYAESAASGKLDNSASSTWYPMTGNPSGFLTAHQDISNKLDTSAFTAYTATALTGLEQDVSSISSTVSGLTGTYVEQSAFSAYSADIASSKQDTLTFAYDADSAISAINGSALAGGGGVVTSTASGEYYDYRTGQLGYYTGIHSANESALIANFATISDYARFDPDRRELSSLVTKDYVDSSISGKADSSGMSSYMPYSSLGYSGSVITSIDGSAIGGQGGEGHEYSGVYPVIVDNTADEISVDSIPLCLESPLSSYMSGDSAIINIDLADYATTAYVDSSVSGKADKTAQVVTSISTGNYTIGGFTVVGVSGINTKSILAVSAGSAQCDSLGRTITATYQPTGAYIYESALGWAEV